MKGNRRKAFGTVKPTLICIGLALFFVSIAIPFSISYAQRLYKPEIVLPEHYPDGFDGFGWIDRIAEDEVVIDDTLIPLSPYILYHTPEETNASREWFVPGSLVGYIKDAENAIESLWLIK